LERIVELFFFPFQDHFIVYRPLTRLAFIANRAMLELCRRLADDPHCPIQEKEAEASSFLEKIGFLQPEPVKPTVPRTGAIYKPTIAVLCLTTACNFRCIYCYARAGEEPARTMPLDLGFKAIEAVCQNARRAGESRFGLVFHGGGEPTLAFSEMRELVRFARSRPLPCNVSNATNGIWADEVRDWIFENIDEVSLSLDGTAAVQNFQRPLANFGPTFEPVLNAALQMDRHRRSYGIRLTVTDRSIEELPAGIEMLCNETRCPVFQIEPAFAHGRASRDSKALTAHQRFAEYFLEAYEVGLRHDRHVYYSGARPWLASSRFCRALDQALVVTPDGMLTACYEVSGRSHPLANRFHFGNMTEPEGWQINDSVRIGLLEKIEQRRSLCSECLCFWHCAGDCPSKTMSPDGLEDLNFGKRCELNRSITQGLLLRLIESGGGVWRAGSGMPSLSGDPMP
jgi:uncharacterized protein